MENDELEKQKLSLPRYNIPEDLEHAIAITTIDRFYNWGHEVHKGLMPFSFVPFVSLRQTQCKTWCLEVFN